MNDQDQLNEPDNNGAYTHVTAVSATEFLQNDILPRSIQQPQKAFEDFRGGLRFADFRTGANTAGPEWSGHQRLAAPPSVGRLHTG